MLDFNLPQNVPIFLKILFLFSSQMGHSCPCGFVRPKRLGAMSISLGVPSPGEARVQALAILRVLGGFRRSMGNIIHDYLMRNLIFLKFTIITNGLLFLSIGDPDLNLDPRCRARKSLRNRRWASKAKIMTKCELSESQRQVFILIL